MPRKHFMLSDQTLGLLGRVKNASGYIDQLVSTTWTRTQQALLALQGGGWKPEEILAACDVLNGSWLLVQNPTWNGASMADGSEYAEKWGIDGVRWKELSEMVLTRVEIAFALDLVVAEFWAGNNHLEALIRKGMVER